MSTRDSRSGPSAGTVPVVVPGDVVLARSAGLAVWVGAITAFPDGFAFTLLTLTDPRRARPPADWALDVAERGQMTWLEIGYADGRRRAADLNANTPRRQPRGPHLAVLNAGGTDSRWWVTPVPPPGPVELAIHLSEQAQPTGVGYLDGAALADAAARAEVVWTTA